MVQGIFSSQQYVMAKQLLDAAALRHAALSSNLANVETPGYKRVDIDKSFETRLQSAASHHDLKALANVKAKVVEDASAMAVRPDGNNVSMDKELMEINRNTAEYEFLSQYASTNLQRITTAIKTSGM